MSEGAERPLWCDLLYWRSEALLPELTSALWTGVRGGVGLSQPVCYGPSHYPPSRVASPTMYPAVLTCVSFPDPAMGEMISFVQMRELRLGAQKWQGQRVVKFKGGAERSPS